MDSKQEAHKLQGERTIKCKSQREEWDELANPRGCRQSAERPCHGKTGARRADVRPDFYSQTAKKKGHEEGAGRERSQGEDVTQYRTSGADKALETKWPETRCATVSIMNCAEYIGTQLGAEAFLPVQTRRRGSQKLRGDMVFGPGPAWQAGAPDRTNPKACSQGLHVHVQGGLTGPPQSSNAAALRTHGTWTAFNTASPKGLQENIRYDCTTMATPPY
jgi:hypothetical protein